MRHDYGFYLSIRGDEGMEAFVPELHSTHVGANAFFLNEGFVGIRASGVGDQGGVVLRFDQLWTRFYLVICLVREHLRTLYAIDLCYVDDDESPDALLQSHIEELRENKVETFDARYRTIEASLGPGFESLYDGCFGDDSLRKSTVYRPLYISPSKGNM